MGVRVHLLDGSHVDYPRAHGATEARSGNLVVWRVGLRGCPESVDEIARNRWASWCDRQLNRARICAQVFPAG